MSRVSDRQARTTIPFDSETLARTSEEAVVEEDDDLFADLELAAPPPAHPNVVAHPGRRAIGTDPPPARSRTVTAHDPFTTSVLAEIARREQAEVVPVQPAELDATDDDDFNDLTPATSPGFHPR